MIGLRRMGVDSSEDMLRMSRAVRLGQAADDDYRREIKRAEKRLNGQ